MLRRCSVALALALVGCGSAGADVIDDAVGPTAQSTVPGVGQLPPAIPSPSLDDSPSGQPGDSDDGSSANPSVDGDELATVAERVDGNRLLVIGDSILASTASRYGGALCAALNPAGWSVEVDAEPGRFVEFGDQVATERLQPDEGLDFDAVVVHVGSNYREDRDAYFDQLNEILYRAAPRPIVLLTVTEYRPAWREVNESIEELAQLYENVTVVDWGEAARADGVLSRDGLHPGERGQGVLVDLIAAAVGDLGTGDGECLTSPYTDDSAVGGGNGSPVLEPSPAASSGSTGGGRAPATTSAPSRFPSAEG